MVLVRLRFVLETRLLQREVRTNLRLIAHAINCKNLTRKRAFFALFKLVKVSVQLIALSKMLVRSIRNSYQPEHRRHLYQYTDHGGECRTGV